MTDFSEKLLDLYQKRKYFPEDIFNADEVNLQANGRSFEFFSTRATVRKNLVGEGHLTVLVCANAAGSLLKPFFIFPGEDMSCLPAGELENCYLAFNNSAYMDEELFKQWLSRMIAETIESRTTDDGKLHPALLLLDGHSSHLNSTTLMTAACHNIDVLCLPSHTMHLLQPNDCALNKTLKDNMQANLSSLLELHEKITLAELAHLFSEAMKYENIPRSVIQSFRHTGVFPHDPLQMSKVLVKEKVKELTDPNEEIIEKVTNLVKEHVSALEKVVKGKGSERMPHLKYGNADFRQKEHVSSLHMNLWLRLSILKNFP